VKEVEYSASIQELEEKQPEGDNVAVGFRPSGELHMGNLLTLTYSAVVADRLGLKLEVTCCDTDWSAHIHQNHLPENSDVMKLFHQRDCPCGEHENIAEHRLEEIKPFLEGLEQEAGIEIQTQLMSEIETEEYEEALTNILDNMEKFDRIFGGGFRRRYRSPVVNVCKCGFSHAKGASYSSETDELVFACRNPDCPEGFASSHISGMKGVYYLVDPVRDPSRNTAVHVFGGDYRDASKEQKTSKLTKVGRITRLACGETPEYFVAPLIANEEGKPLSKSLDTGKRVSSIEDLQGYAKELFEKTEEWIEEDQEVILQENL
jgi:lysyl-tRNA synthetase class I